MTNRKRTRKQKKQQSVSPFSSMMERLKEMEMMRNISQYAGNKAYRWMSPKNYPEVGKKTRVVEEVKHKSPTFSRRQVLGRIRGFQHEPFATVNVPILPRARWQPVEQRIRNFFSERENRQDVYSENIWTPLREYSVYAVFTKNQVSVLIYTDHQISETLQLLPLEN